MADGEGEQRDNAYCRANAALGSMDFPLARSVSCSPLIVEIKDPLIFRRL